MAISLKVPHFIFYSTANAYVHDGEIKHENSSWDIEHRPDYFASKFLGEKLLQNRIIGESTKLTILRLGSLYGPGEPERNIIPTIFQNARAKKQIKIVNNGLNTHNFLYITDAVQASLLASKNTNEGVFNIGAVDSITLKELVWKLSGLFKDLEMLVKYEHFETDAWSGCAPFSIEKAQKYLHFNPASLDNNLQSYIRVYMNVST
jgi:ADP-L-glycero-D-manno-heptose 6-epimerase